MRTNASARVVAVRSHAEPVTRGCPVDGRAGRGEQWRRRQAGHHPLHRGGGCDPRRAGARVPTAIRPTATRPRTGACQPSLTAWSTATATAAAPTTDAASRPRTRIASSSARRQATNAATPAAAASTAAASVRSVSASRPGRPGRPPHRRRRATSPSPLRRPGPGARPAPASPGGPARAPPRPARGSRARRPSRRVERLDREQQRCLPSTTAASRVLVMPVRRARAHAAPATPARATDQYRGLVDPGKRSHVHRVGIGSASRTVTRPRASTVAGMWWRASAAVATAAAPVTANSSPACTVASRRLPVDRHEDDRGDGDEAGAQPEQQVLDSGVRTSSGVSRTGRTEALVA